MTVKRPLKVLDAIIKKKSQLKSDLLNPDMPWNQRLDEQAEFSLQLATVIEGDIKALKGVRKELQVKRKQL